MRFPLHSWKLPLFSVAFLALLVAFLNPSDPGITSPDIEYVQRVVDGDTLLLGTGERVRLIGVDTPETKRPNTPVEYFGKEASAFTKRLAEGKRIRLEYDQANNHLGHKDQYVYLPRRWDAVKCGDHSRTGISRRSNPGDRVGLPYTIRSNVYEDVCA